MNEIGVICNFQKNSIKGQIFKLAWSKGALFDADFVPEKAFGQGTYCDVDISNLQLAFINGDIKLCQRAHINQDIQSIIRHISMKQCLVVSNVWRKDDKKKTKTSG